MNLERLSLEVAGGQSVSALLLAPERPIACYVMAHGAGAGMTHEFMTDVAEGLAARNIATFRYQFPYMEQGSRRPDRPPLAHATVRAAVAAAIGRLPSVKLIAGGKSFGGRMTSQAQAIEPLPHVRGLAFFGFPLHPANKPSEDRADHLLDVRLPMLFLSGTRDALADLRLLRDVTLRLGDRATLTLLENADHSLRVPARAAQSNARTLAEALDAMAAWARAIPTGGS